jgi:hypothetical protein
VVDDDGNTVAIASLVYAKVPAALDTHVGHGLGDSTLDSSSAPSRNKRMQMHDAAGVADARGSPTLSEGEAPVFVTHLPAPEGGRMRTARWGEAVRFNVCRLLSAFVVGSELGRALRLSPD